MEAIHHWSHTVSNMFRTREALEAFKVHNTQKAGGMCVEMSNLMLLFLQRIGAKANFHFAAVF